MKTSTTTIALFVSTTTSLCQAFAPHSNIPLSFASSKTKNSVPLYSHAIDADDEAMKIMMKANFCANSDTCSIEEAEEYLNEVLHIQSNCVTGALHSDLICDEVTFPSEVIAGLREKIGTQVEISNQSNVVKIGFNPIFLTILALYVSTGAISLLHNNPESFTMQEWMYALKGGYLDTMLSQYIKYGGLSPIEDNAAVLPFTLNEWWWSVRDGYLGNMVHEQFNHGGLLTMAAEEDMIATQPFTTQEWVYALKDGYLGDMFQHYIRNGGL